MALRARAPSSAKSKQAAMPRSAPRRRRSLAHFMVVEAAESRMAGAYPCRSHRHHTDRRSLMKSVSTCFRVRKKTPLFKRGRSQTAPEGCRLLLCPVYLAFSKQKLPEAKFYVLGSNVTQEILALATDDVVVVGYVEDLSHYLDRCRMSVVPGCVTEPA